MTVQVICGFEVCATVAEKICRAPGIRVALVGVMLTRMLLVSCSVTEALCAGFALPVALMVTCRPVGIFTGARYNPFRDGEFEIVPTLVFPPGMSLTLQVTACVATPPTLAEN